MKNKVIGVSILSIIIFFSFTLKVNAEAINLDDWIPDTTGGSNERLEDITGKILGVIQVVGTIVAVIMLIIIGIKYMCASIEEKVQYRKSMMPYFIGSIMVLSITNITAFIYEIVIGLNI